MTDDEALRIMIAVFRAVNADDGAKARAILGVVDRTDLRDMALMATGAAIQMFQHLAAATGIPAADVPGWIEERLADMLGQQLLLESLDFDPSDVT